MTPAKLIATLAIWLAGLFCGAAHAQRTDWTLAYVAAPGSVYNEYAQSVGDRVAKATGGRVRITPSDSLVPGAQLASAMRDGRVQMAGGVLTYLAAEEPRMGLFNLPGLINSIGEYDKVCAAFYCRDTARLWLERWNGVVLAQGAFSSQQVWSKSPIRTAEDFRNKRIRVHNPQTAQVMDALGAKPTPLAIGEVIPALERGVLDAVITSAEIGNGLEFWRSAKHVQAWSLGPVTLWAFVVNKDAWSALPPDLQQQVRAVFAEVESEARRRYDEVEPSAFAAMQVKGVTGWAAPPAEVAKVTAPQVTQAAYKAWYERARQVGFDGEQYVQQARKAIGR
jgi:TRAP-type transport system periplasmic protein